MYITCSDTKRLSYGVPDVKDRLIALRGKGMPNLFSWSYKRYSKLSVRCLNLVSRLRSC